MSLNLEFFSRPTNITAKVVCDSVSEQGVRLTTFEIEYPRIVMSEFNTHRAVSKNSSSSRAIPVSKMLEHTKSINLKPIYFGSKKSGMQAGDELVGLDLNAAHTVWEDALVSALGYAELLDNIGVAKEVTNRLVEPFQLVKVVCTATDWENFFNLRLHPDADPNICMLAYKMYKAMEDSKPQTLYNDEYHTPYVEALRDGTGSLLYFDKDGNYLTWVDAIKLSVASCASVSYRTEGMTLEKAEKIFDMLIKVEVVHSSPFEHLATPVKIPKCIFKDNEYVFADSEVDLDLSVNLTYNNRTWEDGITHVNRQGELCSGNLRGWVQYRHLLPNNTAWEFDFEERMKMFK